jgi:hypothetical protein
MAAFGNTLGAVISLLPSSSLHVLRAMLNPEDTSSASIPESVEGELTKLRNGRLQESKLTAGEINDLAADLLSRLTSEPAEGEDTAG